GSESQVAGRGNGGPTARADARHRRNRGDGATLDGVQNAVHLAFIGNAILAILEIGELGDVGPGGKRPVARAGDDQGLGLLGAADAAADRGYAFIHGESEGIARLGPIEGDPAGLAALVVEQFLGHFLCHIERAGIVGEAPWRWNGFSRASPISGWATTASIS